MSSANDSIVSIDDEETNSNFSSEFITDNELNKSLNKKYKTLTKHGRPRESFIWDHFIEEGDYRICKVKVPVSSQFPNGLCGKRFPNTSTTSNSINHLLKSHNILPTTEQQKVYIVYHLLNILDYLI